MIIARLRFDDSRTGNSRSMMDQVLRRMAAAHPAKFITGLVLLACLAEPAPAATKIGTAVLVVNNVYGKPLKQVHGLGQRDLRHRAPRRLAKRQPSQDPR